MAAIEHNPIGASDGSHEALVQRDRHLAPAARPFVKWAGGKRRLVASLMSLAPMAYERYLEPFLGGGAVALALGHRSMMLNDSNSELIDAYRAVRDNLAALLERLDLHQAAHDREHFYAVRALEPADLTPLDRAARLIYLNKTCFNGLWRVNRAGRFNTPIGRVDRPALYDRETMLAASTVLQHASLAHQDYALWLDHQARPGDFIYLDPPYDPAGGFADFKRYTAQPFGVAAHTRLADLFHELIRRGATPVLSNADTELVRRLYRDHSIQVIAVPRAISGRSDRRGLVRELLITPRQIHRSADRGAAASQGEA